MMGRTMAAIARVKFAAYDPVPRNERLRNGPDIHVGLLTYALGFVTPRPETVRPTLSILVTDQTIPVVASEPYRYSGIILVLGLPAVPGLGQSGTSHHCKIRSKRMSAYIKSSRFAYLSYWPSSEAREPKTRAFWRPS